MSTRIKVFNYVMSAPPAEVTKTLDEARALLATRRSNEKSIAASAGAKAAHTVQAKATAKAKAVKAQTKAPAVTKAPSEAAAPKPLAVPPAPSPATSDVVNV